MRLAAIFAIALCAALVTAALSAQEAAEMPASPGMTADPALATAKEKADREAESFLEPAYILTWDKEPRLRGREPFQSVLHILDSGVAGKKTGKIQLPRTPMEEVAFAERAAALLAEAQAGLGQADYKAIDEKVDTIKQMIAVPMVTQAAKDKMAVVIKQFADFNAEYSKIRARAALAEALQLAARMQAYFDSERFGEVLSAYIELQALNDEKGLGNLEVAATAADILTRCAELERRAEIRMEFAKMNLKVDAISCFPEGRSFAIINGEVTGEGALVAPELTLAAVASGKVTFDYKGEKISQGLAAPKEGQPVGKRGKEGMTR